MFPTQARVFNSLAYNEATGQQDTKIILSHAGGFLPYAYVVMCAVLVAELISHGKEAAAQELVKFRKFYFETALTSGPMAIPSLLAFADHRRTLFGSVFPYAPRPAASKFNDMLEQASILIEAQKIAFNRGNAKRLLKRLAG